MIFPATNLHLLLAFVSIATFDHGKHPWWPRAPGDPRGPKKRQETSRRRRSSVGTPWWTTRPSGPAVCRWFGPSLFHLGAFWCWKSGVSDFVGCFLIGYGAQTEKNMDKVQHLRQVLTKSVSFTAEKQTGFSNYARDQHAEVLFHGAWPKQLSLICWASHRTTLFLDPWRGLWSV